MQNHKAVVLPVHVMFLSNWRGQSVIRKGEGDVRPFTYKAYYLGKTSVCIYDK